MTIEELILKLPADLQDIARRYATFYEGATDDLIEQYILAFSRGDWQGAYENIVANMSSNDLADEYDRINAIIADLVTADHEVVQMQKVMVIEAMTLLVKMAKAAIITG